MADASPKPPTFALPLRPRANDQDVTTPDTTSGQSSGLLSPDIAIELHDGPEPTWSTPPPRSALPLQSPIRHHKRTPSAQRKVKETLDARFEYANDVDDGRSHHRINQYLIKDEIGRGSFGAVHLATDQFGNEFAVKEFSKARLRKRAQSSLLRHGPKRFGYPPGRAGFGAPGTPHVRLSNHKADEAKDALFLIREEVAIMKKLNHENLVQLIEVLVDPDEDSLYMVLEMCKKGVVMKVGLGEPAEPYPEEKCRHYFRDLILGIEYLHSQGVVHRDIKPDNLLITHDDVLKVVDFGVSEMFEKTEEMVTAKSAGSPAFLPPELCAARHGGVSGKAADLWAMGVTLYCLRYGKIPFERASVLDMYEAIKTETPKFPPGESEEFLGLMSRLMEKDPEKRITMAELREHSWVTKRGEDPLLSAEENCTDPVDLPNALEVNHAFTRRMSHLLCVMKAISKFKSLLTPKDGVALPEDSSASCDGTTTRVPEPVVGREKAHQAMEAEASSADDIAKILEERKQFLKSGGGAKLSMRILSRSGASDTESGRSETLLLGIGTGGMDDFGAEPVTHDIVSDSPTAVDFNIYDQAFSDEVDRIKRSTSRKGSKGSKVYHNRLNERSHHANAALTEGTPLQAGDLDGDATPRSSASALASQQKPSRFADLVAKAMMDATAPSQ